MPVRWHRGRPRGAPRLRVAGADDRSGGRRV